MSPFNRLRDIILAVLGLILSVPLLLLIAASVWIDSPGPVIFRQQRLGKDGKLFTMYKFRKFPHSLVTKGGGLTLGRDPRMTRVGALLERIKFDELPQLWNILVGDMAFVGPRPESLHFQDLFTGRYASLLQFHPGLFGPSQISCRNEHELYPPDVDPDSYYREVIFPRKGDRDLGYMAQATFWSDMLLIIKGVLVSAGGFVNWRRLVADHGLIILVDLVAALLSWGAANLIRFAGIPPVGDMGAFTNGFLVLPTVAVLVMFLGGAYRHLLRYFSLDDAVTLVRASALGWFMAGIALIGIWSRETSLLAFILSWLFFVLLLFMPRLFLRYRWSQQNDKQETCNQKTILVYGAGTLGISLARYLELKEGAVYQMLGFMDDNVRLKGRNVVGLRILGGQADLATFHSVHAVSEVWLACNMDKRRRESLSLLCKSLEVSLVPVCDQYPFRELASQPDKQDGKCLEEYLGRSEDSLAD